MIMGKEYIGYENTLDVLKIERLNQRRESLCMKFAIKTFKNLNYSPCA